MNSDRKIPKKLDGSTDYMEIVRRFEAGQQADDSAESGKEVKRERADMAEAPVARTNAINAESATEQEARVLLDGMLAAGASFQVLRESGEAVLVWFGSAATVTPEIRAEVSRLKPEIVGLFLGGYPQSLRKWGRP